VVDIGDDVGKSNNLAFEGDGFVAFCPEDGVLACFGVFGYTVQHFKGEVEPFALFFDGGENTNTVGRVSESLVEFSLDDTFPCMAKGGMSNIVAKGNGFGEVFIETEGTGNGSGDLGDFKGMSESCAKGVAGGGKKDLCFVLEAAECLAVDDTISISHEFGTEFIGLLGVFSSFGLRTFGGSGREIGGFKGFPISSHKSLLQVLEGDDSIITSMKRSYLYIGIFCAFCTVLLYGEEVYTTSIGVMQTNSRMVFSWLANRQSGDFALFEGEKPLVSLEALGEAHLVAKTNLLGEKRQNLYHYDWVISGVTKPYFCILPVKERYVVDDILPVLNATVVPFVVSGGKEAPREESLVSLVQEGKRSGGFQVKGSVFGERVVLSWFFDSFVGEEYVVYRLNVEPSKAILQSASPLAHVTSSLYEDIPPVGGPYYYVVLQGGSASFSSNNVVGPLWFPAPPVVGKTREEVLP